MLKENNDDKAQVAVSNNIEDCLSTCSRAVCVSLTVGKYEHSKVLESRLLNQF